MIQLRVKLVKDFFFRNDFSMDSFLGWRNFDDEHVSSLTNEKDLVRSDAYVLFYRHRHLPVDFLLHEQNQSPVYMDTYEDALTTEDSHMKDVNDFLK
jgi:hypothetical protein